MAGWHKGSRHEWEKKKKALSEGVYVHQPAFSQEQSFKKTQLDIYVLIV